ncbi:MAG: GNAT family N-acetyltransferase [Clostridiales bacterium]|nr:GNAT family N-acetyltransferase [Clostridiales bacterium]
MNINYRQIRKEDGYEWYTLLSKVWRVAYSHIFPEKVFDARDKGIDDKVREFTEEKFLGERKIAYVAECEGKIVGIMFGTLDSTYEYFKKQGYADLVALYVYPEYQGMGIGAALKDIFVKWAKEKGADRFVIGVLKENAKARKVYESWGGQLSEHEQDFEVMNVRYPESFYTYEKETN